MHYILYEIQGLSYFFLFIGRGLL